MKGLCHCFCGTRLVATGRLCGVKGLECLVGGAVVSIGPEGVADAVAIELLAYRGRALLMTKRLCRVRRSSMVRMRATDAV